MVDSGMVDQQVDRLSSRLVKRWYAYHQEVEAIGRKLVNPKIPKGKREKLCFRLKDLKKRLIPSLSQRIWL